MNNKYVYCYPDENTITCITKKALSKDQRGSRIELVVDSRHPAMADADRKVHYKMNDSQDDLVATGKLTLAESLVRENWDTLNAEEKADVLREYIAPLIGISI